MCGIFGEFGKLIASEQEFRALNDINIRRGPDDAGYWTDSKACTLGFRRLSIIDLSRNGNQPMHCLGGEWVMVMNGEVYNYKALYEELGRPALTSGSDTEVVVNVFEKFGVEAGVKKLNGMFAIAAYHTTENVLYLIRDSAGINHSVSELIGANHGKCPISL